MVKIDYNTLEEIKQKIDDKRETSDALALVITGLQQETNPGGDIELVIKKSQLSFLVRGSELVPFLQSKKSAIDADIQTLLDKITIKP